MNSDGQQNVENSESSVVNMVNMLKPGCEASPETKNSHETENGNVKGDYVEEYSKIELQENKIKIRPIDALLKVCINHNLSRNY